MSTATITAESLFILKSSIDAARHPLIKYGELDVRLRTASMIVERIILQLEPITITTEGAA